MGRGLPVFLAVVLLSAGCSTGGLADLSLPAPGLGAGDTGSQRFSPMRSTSPSAPR
ncbi:MCE-family lipoMce6E domain protein [Mycobacteroides abscessus subsp. bolletii 1513]|uniref:MCE-family lipoMce6E domain protein n=1 Tax=Mycobacteroides abscessus subsp. bolletii 1513 TaxID=1299321 RepID=X8DPT5_9MYCO|nr:MCE-family lipoMce6E domain protein [Mycobacteroides abscessus subsp. bolletii 1513]